MAHTSCLERKKAFHVVTNDEVSTGLHHATPSFAARIFQLIFKRKSSSDDARPKSWSGKPKPSPTTAKESLARHASAIIPIEFKPSVQSASTRTTRNEEHCASWRQRQTHCVNCGRLFFTILSPLSSSAGQFCSLDCKTSFEYVNHLEEVLAQHMLGERSESLGSSSDDEDYEVEELDVEQLWS
ncbi:hypothetical protein V7S43_017537 [Phytophthora oleae]|uniref:FLZ-type domain-containing protein n=1 Tax=Phytophthora oleae TaxID=2107226 RepID=A0ABD3ESU0_9STRA